jgi:uncharacterized protein
MMKPTARVGGFQVAFLVFAVVFMSIPIVKYSGPWEPHEEQAFGRALIFGAALALICGIDGLRRESRALLAVPIARKFWPEVTAITLLHLLTPFALCGAIVLEAWMEGGGNAVSLRTSTINSKNIPGAEVGSVLALLMLIPVGCLLAPIVEELVFRGFLFRTWMRQFGWFVAMILTAAAFGIYHPFFTAAATGSLIYSCLFLRTASLRAPIVVHCLYNTLVSYPLLGQFVFKGMAGDASDIASWWPQLVCLGAIAVLVPFYVWAARAPSTGEP